MNGVNFYQFIWQGYNGTLVQGSMNAANGLLRAIGPELASALFLLVIVVGVLMTIGKLAWNTGVIYLVRTLMVSAVLTAGNYTTYVMTMFLTTIPNWIAGAMGNSGSAQTVPQQFASLQSAVDNLTSGLLMQAQGWAPVVISQRISINLADAFAEFMLLCSFVIVMIATAFVAVVAPAGVVILIAYLFESTKQWPERWIGKLVSLMLLQLFVSVLLDINMTQFAAYMHQVQGATAGSLDQQIAGLWNIGYCFAFGLLLLVGLPLIAGAIGGSAVSNVVIAPLSIGRTMSLRGMAAAGAAGGRAGAAAASGSRFRTGAGGRAGSRP